MHSRIRLGARLNRRWYLPGDIVRFEVSLENDNLSTFTQQYATPSLTGGQNTSFSNASEAFITSTENAEWILDALEVSIRGHCSLDPEWFSSDWLLSPAGTLQYPFISTSLLPLLPNEGNVEPQQSIFAKVLSMVKGDSTNTTEACLSLHYPLFESPRWTIARPIPGNHGGNPVFSFSVRLPDELPPSFEGTHAKIEYILSITAKWRCEGEGENKEKGDKITTLKIPIRVFCMAATASTIFIKSIFPLRIDHPLIVDNYSFSFCLLNPTSSSCNTTTTKLNSERKFDNCQRCKPLPYWYDIRSNSEALMPKPRSLSKFDFIPPNGDRTPVQLILHSTKVAIGSSVIGVFNHHELEHAITSKADELTLVPLSACVSLEFLECGNEYGIRQGRGFRKAYGLENLAIIRCHTFAKESLSLLYSPSTSFTFHLSTENLPGASFFTDIISAMWHIRVRVSWGIYNAMNKIDTESGEVVEAVIPIIVEPSPAPPESRCKIAR